MEKTVNHDKQMPKAPGLRLRTAGRQRADAVQRHRRNVEAFHLLKIQRIKGMEQRRLQFSLHTTASARWRPAVHKRSPGALGICLSWLTVFSIRRE